MISAILLAAGSSSRMKGENKLMKKIKGKPLIQHSINNLLGSAVDEIVIILGYENKTVQSIIKKNKKIKIVFNKNYKNGISTSIKVGIKNISSKSNSFFVCLADMPNINQNIYNKLIKAKFKYNKKVGRDLKKDIIIPTFEGKNGNPVLFSKQMKSEMLKIKGDYGAKELIRLNKNKSMSIPVKNSGIILDYDKSNDFNF